MFRLADLPRSESGDSPNSCAFAAQLALAAVHPQLAPLCACADGYALLPYGTAGWFELQAGRGLAGYGLSRALRILLDLLAGVTALHETRTKTGEAFVHGELVPALVRVDSQGIARLMPLAAWHWSAAARAPLPESQGHVSPERLLGDALDGRGDVFSAGVLLWEALAGRRLFDRDSSDAIIARLMGGKVLLPELPPELSWAIPLKAIAYRAISVDPEQRFADCAMLAAAIAGVARAHVATHTEVAAFLRARPPAEASTVPKVRPGASPHYSSLSALVAPAARPAPPSVEPEAPAPAARGRNARTAWVLAAFVSLVVALVAGAFSQRGRTRPPAFAAGLNATALAVPPKPGASTEPLPVVAAAVPVASAPGGSAVPSARAQAVPPIPAPRGAKSRAPAKAARPATPRGGDNAAAQYGI